MNDDNDEFANWWRAPEQEELRKSCAMGWGRYIWQASRAALKVELPDWEFPHYSEVVEALQQAGIEVVK